MAIYVIVTLSHPSRLNDARKCTKDIDRQNAQVGSEERNICEDVIHESAATKIVCQQQKYDFRQAAVFLMVLVVYNN